MNLTWNPQPFHKMTAWRAPPGHFQGIPGLLSWHQVVTGWRREYYCGSEWTMIKMPMACIDGDVAMWWHNFGDFHQSQFKTQFWQCSQSDLTKPDWAQSIRIRELQENLISIIFLVPLLQKTTKNSLQYISTWFLQSLKNWSNVQFKFETLFWVLWYTWLYVCIHHCWICVPHNFDSKFAGAAVSKFNGWYSSLLENDPFWEKNAVFTSGKGHLQMIKKTPHFVLNF
jgi:hypothetical protein